MTPGGVTRVGLTADLVEVFAGAFLSPMYDNPQPTPDFHRTGWELYCQDIPLAGLAAPREHAKSTAFTHDFVLATICFRAQDFVVIVSAVEDLAIAHLADIAKELRENDELRREFRIASIPVDSKTDIIVRFADGHEAKIVPRGAGQKMRGLKWRGKRPGLIVCDDLEEDEQVENRDRRRKFRNWFNRALLPCVRRGGWIRMHGTILHEDAVLARIIKGTAWETLVFRAHRAFDDFSDILWPEQFPEERLRAKRKVFIEDGDAAGYSQEFLNDPRDNSEAYLRREDFLPMVAEDYARPKMYKCGCDFAVSKADHANRTSFTVGGQDSTGLIHVVNQQSGRWDPTEWIQEMFRLNTIYADLEFIVEGGVIWRALEETIFQEMRRKNHYLSFTVINPVKDKATRGKPLQKRHRGGGMRFDKQAEWYDVYESVCLSFTGYSEAAEDDEFDSTALLVKGFEAAGEVEDDDFVTQEELDFIRHDPRRYSGRNATTGY